LFKNGFWRKARVKVLTLCWSMGRGGRKAIRSMEADLSISPLRWVSKSWDTVTMPCVSWDTRSAELKGNNLWTCDLRLGLSASLQDYLQVMPSSVLLIWKLVQGGVLFFVMTLFPMFAHSVGPKTWTHCSMVSRIIERRQIRKTFESSYVLEQKNQTKTRQ
jgi:hypothetical protein